jgi:hypothetical protein
MRRFCAVVAGVGVLALVPVFLPAEAEANHTLAHKVALLQSKVAALQAKVNCLRRYAFSEYLGYAVYTPDGSGGLLDGGELIAGNLQVALGDTSAPDIWVAAVANTRACRAKFPLGANPYSLVTARPAAPAQLERLR